MSTPPPSSRSTPPDSDPNDLESPDAIEQAEQLAEMDDDAPDENDLYVAEADEPKPSNLSEQPQPESFHDEIRERDAADDESHDSEVEPTDEASDVGDTESDGSEVETDSEEEPKKPAKRTRKKAAKKASSRKKTASKAASETDEDAEEDDAEEARSAKRSGGKNTAPTRMIVNYVPGEECRIAQVEDGQLEEFHAERMDAISRVNNIYVGRVANVESGIQAAFVDFGIGESGFLHVTDLHPRYFPGADDDDSERVGRKTPRRERPPIQQALKRGQEIVVQVLKEGVGTKGPTLTSYLSIPGRYLVMMPQMDQVGVSRKVEDEQTRKDMRKILDGLDLPENFGFILRTAGIGKTKTELKRDLAYLQRLWKDLDKRHRSGRAPRLLYSESDLLLRALRDFLTPEIDEIVIDNEHALRRASQFLKIAAPRSSVRLRRYTGPAPVFEAFGIEEQLELMQSREVPLPSGGRLVIDQTEAVVAIDVNSGKMRSAKDSETNALKTNLEAVDEICRQLRLRDMGGIVINDLIDMRQSKNRKAVETRFKERLKRDRARSSVAGISPFGILEMTRQRMRGSLHSQVFTDCPTCHGRGAVKRPSSVASEAIRRLATILSHEKVAKVELVVGGRVSGELLSKKRKALARLEHSTNKQVLVRVMEMSEPDRTVIYAYGPNGQDVDVARLPRQAKPEQWLEVWDDPTPDADWSEPIEEEDVIEEVVDPLAELDDVSSDDDNEEQAQSAGKKKRRRRRRRKGKGEPSDNEAAGESPESEPESESESESKAKAETRDDSESDDSDGDKPKKKRRRRRRGGKGKSAQADDAADSSSDESDAPKQDDATEPGAESESDDSDGDKPKKKRRRRRRRGGKGGDGEGDNAQSGGEARGESRPEKQAEPTQTEVKPKRRSLYGASRRKLSTAEMAKVAKRKD